jgi:uncharacterized iron-regulated protein
MKIDSLTPILTYSLGFWLFCSLPTLTPPGLALPLSKSPVIVTPINRNNLIQELAKAKIIYLGETHNQIQDHQVQLQIIKLLYQQNPKIVIALEMFQRPYQDVLDQYLQGKITESQLIEQTQYHQRWGFPWENYAEIMRFAQKNNLPLLAINTPTEVTRKVAKEGLESLTPSEQKYIPPISEINLNSPEYRQMLLEIYQQHHHGGKSNSSDFENFFRAQILWDETMADAIANYVKINPDSQVIVLVGQGHVIYNYGIPSRVQRRLEDINSIQRSILFQSPDQDPTSPNNSHISDFIWQH